MDQKEQLIKRYLHFGDIKSLTDFVNATRPSDMPQLISNSSKFIAAFEAFKCAKQETANAASVEPKGPAR